MTRNNEQGAVIVMTAIVIMALVAVISLVITISAASDFKKLTQRILDRGVEVAGIAVINSTEPTVEGKLLAAKAEARTFVEEELSTEEIPRKYYRDQLLSYDQLNLESGTWYTADPAPCGVVPCFEPDATVLDALRLTVAFPQLRLLFGGDMVFPGAQIKITLDSTATLNTGQVSLVVD